MSSPRYWLSASVLTIRSAPSLRLGVEAGLKGGRQALVVGEADDVLDPVGAGHVHRAVGGAVVDHEQLDRVHTGDLAGQVGDRLRQGRLLIEAGNLDDQLHRPIKRSRAGPCQAVSRLPARVNWLTDQSIKVQSRTSERNRDRRSGDRPPTRGQAPPAGARTGRRRPGPGQPEPDGGRGDRRRPRRGDRRGSSRRAGRPARRAGRDRRLPRPGLRSGRRDHVRHAGAMRAPGPPASLYRGDPRGGDLAGGDRL